VAGTRALKAATGVGPDTPVTVRAVTDTPDYVSRGAHKLAGALAVFGRAMPPLTVDGKTCLDAGASTGGFTDVLLRAGAARVAAVDVGYGQLAWPLRQDPRVEVLERTNVRSLTPDQIGGRAALTVADLSFIGLRVVLPALAACTAPDGDLVLLVKPQFEVGREQLGEGGVVREPDLRAAAVIAVAKAARELRLQVRGVVASSLPGPSGNVEYCLWLAGAAAIAPEPQEEQALDAAVARAVREGPT
jgi:23S rRNA (cytidine1920-2'-O)/16S rRNA (cytidine1409-2'-O)-methyltransferase